MKMLYSGLNASRTEFIRSAIRRELDVHRESLDSSVRRKSGVFGVLSSYTMHDVEKRYDRGEVLDVTVIGMLILEDDISTKLARATINSITVFGVFRASDRLREALADRIYG